ncbi:MAG: hypothetical protein CM15mP54_20980 [Paracoccaceae bacterium]|nr:MAG: hypothetical protein CM15mP54_20980 [Paracoccaceae bacterium]
MAADQNFRDTCFKFLKFAAYLVSVLTGSSIRFGNPGEYLSSTAGFHLLDLRLDRYNWLGDLSDRYDNRYPLITRVPWSGTFLGLGFD